MTHIWTKDYDESWSVVALDTDDTDCLVLEGNAARPVVRPEANAVPSVAPLLVRHGIGAREQWAIVTRASDARVRVNGEPLFLGVRILNDRDEIRTIGGTRIFYSTERLAHVETFPGAAPPIFCPRCKQSILAQTLAVRCPSCHAWYHHTDELPCWTYANSCALCGQSTDFKAGYQWTPEELFHAVEG